MSKKTGGALGKRERARVASFSKDTAKGVRVGPFEVRTPDLRQPLAATVSPTPGNARMFHLASLLLDRRMIW